MDVDWPALRLRPPKSPILSPLKATTGVLCQPYCSDTALSPHSVRRTSLPESSTSVSSRFCMTLPDCFVETISETSEAWRTTAITSMVAPTSVSAMAPILVKL